MNSTEEKLFAQLLKRGDEKAFSVLYDSLWENLFGYVVRVLQDKEDSMDVVQDTFITVWQQRDTMEKVTSIKAYIFSIARYKALRYIRMNIRKRDYLASLLHFLHEYEESPERLLITEELQTIIDIEVSNLPPKMREVFLLSREQQLSYKEIAAKLNISDKTVKKQIGNALKLLRLKIDNEHLSTLLLLILLERIQ